MIWINRLLSFPLGIVLLALLMVSLILVRVSDTLLDPEYYLLELKKADIYEFVLVDLLTSGLEEAMELSSDRFSKDIDENPSVMSGLSSDRIVVAINRAVPHEWVREQIENALDETTPYLLGKRDNFEIRIRLSDRVEVALEEIKILLREVDAYDLLYAEVVDSVVLKNLGAVVTLPFGVEVTQEEVLSVLREVAPPEWVHEQTEMLIDDASQYLTGQDAEFSAEISLIENKRMANDVIADLVNARLMDVIDNLPTCQTRAETLKVVQETTDGLPSCFPAELSITQFLELSSIDIIGAVQQDVLRYIPDKMEFTDSQLRLVLKQAGAGNNLDLIDAIREILSDGWTYTHLDFREYLARQDPVALSRYDLFFVSDTPIEQLDIARNWLYWTHTYKWVTYLPTILFLVIIGFLGSRGWTGRLIWAASSLLVCSTIIIIIAGPVYDSLASTGFARVREQALQKIDAQADHDFQRTFRLVTLKSIDMGRSIADDFSSGIRNSAVNLAIISLVVILIAVFWNRITAAIVRRSAHLRRFS